MTRPAARVRSVAESFRPRRVVAPVARLGLGLLAAVSSGALSHALAQSLPAGSVITPTGDTSTNVSSSGSTATITTSTVSGRNAFNSFSAFTVGSDLTVNMVVPTSADRLVNIVRGQQVSIQGILNSYRGSVADANRGGDVWFVAPGGFVVGSTGVINVGRLSVATPTDSFASDLVSSTDNVSKLLAGDYEISSQGAIRIDGKINALDGVRLIGDEATIGGEIRLGVSALEARDAQNAQIFAALVNAQGLQQGGELVYSGGDLELKATGDVTVSGKLSAKAGRDPVANSYGTIRIESGGAIDLTSTSELVTDRVGGALDGKVDVKAETSGSAGYGEGVLTSDINLSGKVRTGDLTALAKSTVEITYKDDLGTFATATVVGGVFGGLAGGYQSAKPTARIDVAGTADLKASNDVSLKAEAIAEASFTAAAATRTSPVQIALATGFIDSTAAVEVTGAAKLTAGRTLELDARNKTTLSQSALAIALEGQSEKGGAAAAYGETRARTKAVVGADAQVDAALVYVNAKHENAFSVSSTVQANGNGKVGIAVAISDQDFETTARFDASTMATRNGVPDKTGAMFVTALTTTTENKTSAGTTTGTGIGGRVVLGVSDGVTNGIRSKLSSNSKTSGAMSQSQNGEATPRIAGALSLAFETQTTKASAGGAGKTLDVIGDTVIAARTYNFGTRNIATSAVESGDGESSSQTSVGISAAVAYSERELNTAAELEAGTTLNARRLAVGADTVVPISQEWTTYEKPTDIISYLNGNLGIANELASSFTTATATSDRVGFGGSFNVHLVDVDTRAWVGENAILNLTGGSLSAVDDRGVGIDWSSVADKTLAVTALSRVHAVNLGGQFSITGGGNAGTGQGSKAIGGSYTGPDHASTTVAGIGAGANVTVAGGVGVNARADNKLFLVAQAAGKGTGVGVVGMVTLAQIDNTTVAAVSDDARVVADAVAIDARQDLLVVNVAAPIPISAEGSAIGVGTAINQVETTTRAGVFDTASYTPNVGAVKTTPATAEVVTDSFRANAVNDGWLTAWGVAGAQVDNNPSRTGVADRAKGAFNKTKLGQKITAVDPAQGGLTGKLSGFLSKGPVQGAQNQPAQTSVAGAGSAAVNLTELTAEALLEGATVRKRTDNLDLTLRAVNTPISLSGAGAGAKVSAQGATSVGVAGALALDVSENDAIAAIRNSTVTDYRNVDLLALNGGVRVAAGIGVALNSPPEGSGSGDVAAAVSASLIFGSDTADASIEGSSLTRTSGTGGAVNVLSYNAPKIGAGGGSGYSGGKKGVGLSLTLIDLGDDTSEDQVATRSAILDSTVTDAGSVTVSAADPAVALALSVSGGKAASDIGVVGAFAVIDSDRTAKAIIGRKTGRSTVSATGAVTVSSAASRSGTLDTISLGKTTDLFGDTDYDFTGGSTVTDLRDEDSGSLSLPTGQNGLFVVAAGAGQISGQDSRGNFGASFGGGLFNETRQAIVDDASVTAGSATIRATDDAVRVGLAVGIGGGGAKFGATGSLMLMEDKGETSARLGGDSAQAVNRAVVNAGSLTVLAQDTSITAGLAGSFTKAGKVSGGAAMTVVDSDKRVKADVQRADVDASGAVSVDAGLRGEIYTLGFTGSATGGDGQATISGAAALNLVSSSARATVRDATVDPLNNVRGSMSVVGSDQTRILTGAIGVAIGGKGAGGVGLAVNTRGGDEDGLRVGAEVLGGDLDVQNFTAQATSTADVKTLAAGVAVGDKFALGGSIVVNVVGGETRARIADTALITAQNNLAVIAKSQDRMDVVAGALGFSKQGGGVGISLVTNVIDGDTVAAVEGGSQASALALSGTGVDVVEGSLNNKPTLSVIGEDDAGLVFNLGVRTTPVTGVAVNASSLNNINLAAISVGAGDKAGVGGNVATSVIAGKTEARIVGASVNQAAGANARQQLDVRASDHSMANSLVGSVGVSSKAGIAGGLDVAVFTRDARAYASNATLDSRARTRFDAESSQTAFGLNVGVGVGKAGVAGAITVVSFDVDTEAFAEGGSIGAGTLEINAESESRSLVATGVAAVGVGAVGGGVTVIDSKNETYAGLGVDDADDTSISGVTVNAGSVAIDADRKADFELYSVGVAAGKVGVAGMLSLALSEDKTRAGVFGGSIAGASGNAGSVSVEASETVSATLGTGAVAAGLVGVAGAIGVLQSTSTVNASIEQATVNANGQTVRATADRDLDGITVGLGVGKVGAAASIGVMLVGSKGTDSDTADIDTALALVDDVAGTNAANADTAQFLTADQQAALANSTTTNSAGRIGTTATQAPGAGTFARVVGSTLTGTGTLTVEAIDTTTAEQHVGGGGAGLAGLGAGVAVTRVANQVTARVDTASTVNMGGAVVRARAQGDSSRNAGLAAHSNAYVGAAGAGAFGVAVAVTKVDNTVNAQAGGVLNGVGGSATLTVEAEDKSKASSNVFNVVVGGGAAAGTVSMASKNGSVRAETLGATRTALNGWNTVSVLASASGRVTAEGLGAAGGATFSANAVYAGATDSTSAVARLGAGTYGRTPGGIEVRAVRTPEVYSNSVGVSVAGFAAMGASVSEAFVEDEVRAEVADGVVLSTTTVNNVALGSDLTVRAEVDLPTGAAPSSPLNLSAPPQGTARAEAKGGSGGGMIGADAAVSRANMDVNVTAQTRENLRMGYGKLTLVADRQSNVSADTTGVAVGGLALGATYAEAKADGDIKALLGKGLSGATGGNASLDDVSLTAGGNDVLDAESTSGSGGIIAGNAAISKAENRTDASVEVLDATQRKAVTAATLALAADYATTVSSRADSYQASALGGSGADARRLVDTSAKVRLGTFADFETFDANVRANQLIRVENSGIAAGSGGVLNASAGISRTDVTPESTVTFAADSALDVIGSPISNPGDLTIRAYNSVTTDDESTLRVGGAIPIAAIDSEAYSTATSGVDVGERAQLTSVGRVYLGAYSNNSVANEGNVSTYGAVGGAGARVVAEATGVHTVNLANGSLIRGGDHVFVAAGRSGDGADSAVNADAKSDVYNYTLLPVSGPPTVRARAGTQSSLTVAAGATVESVRDVNLSSFSGIRTATSDGSLHNPYLEIFSTTVDSSDSSTTENVSATLTVNGSVRAGIQAKQSVQVAADGSVSMGPGTNVSATRAVFRVREELQDQLNALLAVDRSTLPPQEIASLDGEIAIFRQLLSEAPPSPLSQADRSDLQTRRSELVLQRAAVVRNDPVQVPTEDRDANGNIVFVSTTRTQDEINGLLAQIDLEIGGIDTLLNATSFQTIFGVTIGDMYAAAGDVNLDALSLAGSGTVRAEGGATISVVNRSQDYLIVNGMFIPDGEGGGGGHVRLSGGAVRPSGLTVTEVDKDVLPQITVSNTASSGKPGIFLQGAISNLGGAIEVVNASGSIAQFAPISGRSLEITAPNGTYAVNLPGQIYHSGAAPEAAWRPFMLLPTSAEQGAVYVANAIYNSNGQYVDGQTFARALLDRSCSWAPGARCINPINFLDLINRKNVDDADFRWAHSGGSFFSMRNVPTLGLNRSYSANQPALDPNTAVTARTFVANAGWININSPVRIGKSNNYSAQIGSSLQSDLDAVRQAASVRGVQLSGVLDFDTIARTWGAATGIQNVGKRAISVQASGDQLIGLKFDFDNNRLVTADVDAAGGGSIRLTGRIYSTTTYGSLEVNSGFGNIRLSNETNLPVLLGTFDTGRGALGRIQITDLNKTGFNSNPLTTWYVYENASGRLSVYDNALNGTSDYLTATLRRQGITANDAYNPVAGARYEYRLSRRASRFVQIGVLSDEFAVYRNSTSSWIWSDSDYTVSGQRFYIDGRANVPFFEQRVGGFVTGYNRKDDGSYANLSFYTTDGSFSWGDGRHDKYVDAVTGVQFQTTASVKADNPIAIRFTGNGTANVNADSRGGLLIGDGGIVNPAGHTFLRGNDGAISAAAGARVETQSIELRGTAVGSASAPIRVITSPTSGALDARATAGGIWLDVSGRADVGQVRAEGGDLVLSATQGVVGRASNATLQGRNVTIDAAAGAVTGLNGGALTIQTEARTISGRTADGELSVSARDDVNLRQPNGDIRLKRVVSDSGNVTLEATNGAIVNDIAEFTVDAANQQRLANVWSDLALTDPNSVRDAVTGFERYVVVLQNERARIHNQFAVSGGQVSGFASGLSPAQAEAARRIWSSQAKAALGLTTDPTDAQVFGYAQSRLNDIESYATQTFGANRPAGFNSTNLTTPFTFTLDPTSAKYVELTRGVWTQSQLEQSISGTALVPVDDTTLLRQSPNLQGARVTVTSGRSIGSNLDPLVIQAQLGRTLSIEERAALAAAGPGDVSVQQLAGGGATLTINRQKLVNVAATGQVRAVADADLFLGSIADLQVDRIQAGASARIKAGGSILNARTDGAAALIARDLFIEASGGTIGSAARTFDLQLNGDLRSARAAGDVRLRQLTGDLRVGVGFSNALFSLQAPTGSILSAFPNTEEVRIQAGAISLTARDDLGRSDRRLQVALSGGGALSGSGRDGYLYAPTGELRLGALTLSRTGVLSGRDVGVLGALSTGAGLTITTPNALTVGPNGSITASGLTSLTGGSISVDAGRAVRTLNGANLGLTATGGTLTLGADAILQSAGTLQVSGASLIAGDRVRMRSAGGSDLFLTGTALFGADADLGATTGLSTWTTAGATFGDRARLSFFDWRLGSGAGSIGIGDGSTLTGRDITLTGLGAVLQDDVAMDATRAFAATLGAGGLAAGDDVRVSGTTVFVSTTGDAAFGDRATIDASGAASVSARDLVLGDDATVEGSTLALAGRALAVGDGARLRGANGLTLTFQTLTFGDDAGLDAGAGALVASAQSGDAIFGSDADLDGRTISIAAAGATRFGDGLTADGDDLVALSGQSVVLGGQAALASGGAVALTGGALQAGDDLSADGDTITVDVSGAAAFGARAALSGASRIDVRSGGFRFGDGLDVDVASGDLVLLANTGDGLIGTGTLSARDVTASAANGTLGLTGTRVDAARDVLLSGRDVLISAATLNAGRDTRLAASRDLSLGGTSTSVGRIVLSAGRQATTAAASTATAASAELNAGSATLAGGLRVTDGLSFRTTDALAAAATFDARSSAGAITVDAGSAAFAAGSNLQAKQTLLLKARGALAAAGRLRTDAALTVEGGGDVTVADASAPGKVRVVAGGGLNVGAIAGGDAGADAVVLDAGGAITAAAGATPNVSATAGGVQVAGRGGVGTATGALRLATSTVTLRAGSGDVYAAADRDLALTGSASGVFSLSTTGSLTARTMAASDLRLTSRGALDLDGAEARDVALASETSVTARNVRLLASSMKVNAPVIDVSATGSATPAFFSVEGWTPGSLATDVRLTLDAPGGAIFDALRAARARIDSRGSILQVLDGRVGERLDVVTPDATLLVTKARVRPEPVVFQLRAPDETYAFSLNGAVLTTTAAMVPGQANRSDGGFIDPNLVTPPPVYVAPPPGGGAPGGNEGPKSGRPGAAPGDAQIDVPTPPTRYQPEIDEPSTGSGNDDLWAPVNMPEPGPVVVDPAS